MTVTFKVYSPLFHRVGGCRLAQNIDRAPCRTRQAAWSRMGYIKVEMPLWYTIIYALHNLWCLMVSLVVSSRWVRWLPLFPMSKSTENTIRAQKCLRHLKRLEETWRDLNWRDLKRLKLKRLEEKGCWIRHNKNKVRLIILLLCAFQTKFIPHYLIRKEGTVLTSKFARFAAEKPPEL